MPSEPDIAMIEQIRAALHQAADTRRAPQMQVYMKSSMPYLGVPAQPVRSITRAAAKASGASPDVLLASAWAVWDQAQYREEWYVALELTGSPVALQAHDLTWLPFYDHIALTGAWWDVVDACSGRLGLLLRRHRAPMSEVFCTWSTDNHLWRRRLSIIGQLDAKEHTDTALLARCILANAADREFFIRKAIGWSLRQYARTDPGWVRAFLSEHSAKLSPLSIREASKHL